MSASTTITEKLERSASDSAAALGMMAIADQGVKRGRSLADQHKAAYSKMNGGIQKLSRAIAHCEQCLPSLKRKLGATDFGMVKSGLSVCRDIKDCTLDQAEDLKVLPEGEVAQEEAIATMAKIHVNLMEHIEGIQEAVRKHQTVVKEPPAELPSGCWPKPGCPPPTSLYLHYGSLWFLGFSLDRENFPKHLEFGVGHRLLGAKQGKKCRSLFPEEVAPRSMTRMGMVPEVCMQGSHLPFDGSGLKDHMMLK